MIGVESGLRSNFSAGRNDMVSVNLPECIIRAYGIGLNISLGATVWVNGN